MHYRGDPKPMDNKERGIAFAIGFGGIILDIILSQFLPEKNKTDSPIFAIIVIVGIISYIAFWVLFGNFVSYMSNSPTVWKKDKIKERDRFFSKTPKVFFWITIAILLFSIIASIILLITAKRS